MANLELNIFWFRVKNIYLDINAPPGDALQLVLAVLLGVDLDARLAAAEGDVHACALVGHQRGQCLHLVRAHVGGVADTSLARAPAGNEG